MPILPLAALAAVALLAIWIWSGRRIVLALRGRRSASVRAVAAFALATALLLALVWLLCAVLRGLSR